MAVSGISFAGSPSYEYQVPAAKEATSEVQVFSSNTTDTVQSKSTNKGLIAGLIVGAAALATTAYAYKTGKANSKEGAKLGEILSNGFKGIGSKISNAVKKLLGKKTVECPDHINNVESLIGKRKTNEIQDVINEFGPTGTRHSGSYQEWLYKNANPEKLGFSNVG